MFKKHKKREKTISVKVMQEIYCSPYQRKLFFFCFFQKKNRKDKRDKKIKGIKKNKGDKTGG
jgi:hypothetical protein